MDIRLSYNQYISILINLNQVVAIYLNELSWHHLRMNLDNLKVAEDYLNRKDELLELCIKHPSIAPSAYEAKEWLKSANYLINEAHCKALLEQVMADKLQMKVMQISVLIKRLTKSLKNQDSIISVDFKSYLDSYLESICNELALNFDDLKGEYLKSLTSDELELLGLVPDVDL